MLIARTGKTQKKLKPYGAILLHHNRLRRVYVRQGVVTTHPGWRISTLLHSLAVGYGACGSASGQIPLRFGLYRSASPRRSAVRLRLTDPAFDSLCGSAAIIGRHFDLSSTDQFRCRCAACKAAQPQKLESSAR